MIGNLGHLISRCEYTLKGTALNQLQILKFEQSVEMPNNHPDGKGTSK